MRQLSLRLHQLTRALDQRFKPHVHRAGVDEENPDQKLLRSRALAAMAAHMVAGIPDREAARQVTDYFYDDGIDGFAVEAADSGPPTIYLIQAKWSAAGTHSFTVHETRSLVSGFAKLRERKLHPENLLQCYLDEIYEAIKTPGARIVLVFASSGYRKVSPTTEAETQKEIDQVTQNKFTVECKYLRLDDFIHELEAGLARRRGVTVSATLLRDRPVDEHYPALQGTISAAELGRWYRDQGRAIFDDNVRVEMDSDVNDEIVYCLLHEPVNFWYFNNGVTALCEHWHPSPVGGPEVPYEFIGLRIVNGAQTVSSIGRAIQRDQDSVAKAQVPIRFVALDTTGPGFGARIAYATNRANPMQPRDLLAMDHVQQRLRDEFKLTWGFTYAIRANDHVPAAATGCSVLEAVIAMASGRLDIATLVAAKDDIVSLWPGNRERYGKLFDDRTSVVEVWRRVQALRLIMAELHGESTCTTQREKAVAVLGDLVIAHIVFRRLGNEGIGDIASEWEGRLGEVAQCTRAALHALVEKVDANSPARSASGNGFKRVSALLRSQTWLAERVPLIRLDDELVAPAPESGSAAPWSSEPEFRLEIRDAPPAMGRRCDGGFLVHAGSAAAAKDWGSLSTTQLRHRRNLRDSLGFVPEDGYLRLTRDALFASPSQAADVLQGHSVNGPDEWVTADGVSYNQVVKDERTPG